MPARPVSRSSRGYLRRCRRSSPAVISVSQRWTITDFGYWLSFAPAFEIQKVLRDYPLAVEPTEKMNFHGRTFADLLGKDFGLLVLHPGTQWFRPR